MFKKLIEAYRNRYFIAPIDLADAAETNRLHILFISPILFVFGLGNIIFFSLMRLWGRDVKNVTFIYFGIFTLVSIFIYIFSRCMKKTVRENSYYLKTIPFYVPDYYSGCEHKTRRCYHLHSVNLDFDLSQ